MTELPVGVKLGQAARSLTPMVKSRAFETVQPVDVPVHGALPQVKSIATRRVPPEADDRVPDGDLLIASPDQNPNASLVTSGENLGVTAWTLDGQFVSVSAVSGAVGLYKSDG